MNRFSLISASTGLLVSIATDSERVYCRFLEFFVANIHDLHAAG
jgi:hypothetical protein